MADPLGATQFVSGAAAGPRTKLGATAGPMGKEASGGLHVENVTEVLDDISLEDSQDAASPESFEHLPNSLEDRIAKFDPVEMSGLAATPATSMKVYTGGTPTAAFGSEIPHGLDSPQRIPAEDANSNLDGPAEPTIATLKDVPQSSLRHSLSLDVETGSFSHPAPPDVGNSQQAEAPSQNDERQEQPQGTSPSKGGSAAAGLSLPLDRAAPPPMSAGLEAVSTARSVQTGTTDLSSQADTVVVHSSSESSPEAGKAVEEEDYSIKAVLPSSSSHLQTTSNNYQTAHTQPTWSEEPLGRDDESSGESALKGDGTVRKLDQDFDAAGAASRPALEQNGGPTVRKLDLDSAAGDSPTRALPGAETLREGGPAPGRKVDNSRPGVTASPKVGGATPSKATNAPDKLSVPSPLRPDITPPEGPFSEEVRLERERIAKELFDAEQEANQATLESQRNSSSGKQAEQNGKPTDDLSAPFTEENLRSDGAAGTGVVTPNDQIPPARPFSPPPGGARAPGFEAQDGTTDNPALDPPEFKGLIYHDGVDAMGRPVVVINADAVAAGVSRKAACHWMLQRLEPIVVQGPYVLVMLNTGRSHKSNRLPAGWLAASYREMSYPFKKNVKHVILVRPSAMLNFMVAIMRPFISKKAYPKLKKVDSLSAMAAATNNEVTLQHLGPRFAAAAGQYITESLQKSPQSAAYQMPAISGNVELQSR